MLHTIIPNLNNIKAHRTILNRSLPQAVSQKWCTIITLHFRYGEESQCYHTYHNELLCNDCWHMNIFIYKSVHTLIFIQASILGSFIMTKHCFNCLTIIPTKNAFKPLLPSIIRSSNNIIFNLNH